MPTAYITLDQALQAFPSSYNGADNAVVSQIILSSSQFLDNYCNRSSGGFNVQSYDELYNGTGNNILFLNNSPLVSIQRIATTQLPAMFVRNNNPDMGCQALVSVTSTGVTLTYIANAITTTQSFTFADYPTVNQLSAAINSAGNNWQSGVMGGFGTWASSDIRATQGAYGARVVTSYLFIHWFALPQFRVNECNSQIYSEFGFCRGMLNWRVTYSAGYSSFPADLQQALAELVYATYSARSVNPNVQSTSLGGFSYNQLAVKSFEGLSAQSKKVIGQYRKHPTPHFSEW